MLFSWNFHIQDNFRLLPLLSFSLFVFFHTLCHSGISLNLFHRLPSVRLIIVLVFASFEAFIKLPKMVELAYSILWLLRFLLHVAAYVEVDNSAVRCRRWRRLLGYAAAWSWSPVTTWGWSRALMVECIRWSLSKLAPATRASTRCAQLPSPLRSHQPPTFSYNVRCCSHYYVWTESSEINDWIGLGTKDHK